MKQSSIEWYRQEILKRLFDSSDNTLIYEIDIFEQAKAMHKEEIKDSYCDGRMSVVNKQIILAEDYYNETFKPAK